MNRDYGWGMMQRVIERQAVEHVSQAARLYASIDKSQRDEVLDNASIMQIVNAMSNAWRSGPSGSDYGRAKEYAEEFARRAGVSFNTQSVILPFGLFQRDLNKATAAAGGYLVGAATAEPVDILRPWSVTARAGVTMEAGFVADSVVPKTSSKATPYWLTNETAAITASTPSIGQVASTPKVAGALVNFSRHLKLQVNAESYVRRELLRTVGTALDQAVLNGSGAAGQPLGLLNTPGANTQSGTSLGQAGVAAMKRKVSAADAADNQIAFIGTPAVRELLETRERAAGSGYVWDSDRVASRPAFATTDMPAASLICGDWSAIYVPIWGSGIELEINPFDPTGFKVGTIQARALLAVDVVVLHPTAFCLATSIT